MTPAAVHRPVGKQLADSEQPADFGPLTALHVATAPHADGGTGRLVALDFTKVALVLVMVLYHWLNYFVGVQGFFYRYLRFVTPSFIFITGFLISRVYLSKYTAPDLRLPRRLLVRGLKLFAIFLALNAVAAA